MGENSYTIASIALAIIWICGVTYTLIVDTEYRKKVDSTEIYLLYTGGTIAAAMFGPAILVFVICIGAPIKIVSLLRGKKGMD